MEGISMLFHLFPNIVFSNPSSINDEWDGLEPLDQLRGWQGNQSANEDVYEVKTEKEDRQTSKRNHCHQQQTITGVIAPQELLFSAGALRAFSAETLR
jgi:hypothetical protein